MGDDGSGGATTGHHGLPVLHPTGPGGAHVRQQFPGLPDELGKMQKKVDDAQHAIDSADVNGNADNSEDAGNSGNSGNSGN